VKRGGLALAAALAFACASAGAQPPTLSALAGSWVFETAPHHETRCTITGTAEARVSASLSGLEIKLHAAEICPDGRSWRAEETCTGALSEGRLLVLCRLLPGGPSNYNPDNFVLDAITPQEMSGVLYDVGIWRDAARWRRPAPALVS